MQCGLASLWGSEVLNVRHIPVICNGGASVSPLLSRSKLPISPRKSIRGPLPCVGPVLPVLGLLLPPVSDHLDQEEGCGNASVPLRPPGKVPISRSNLESKYTTRVESKGVHPLQASIPAALWGLGLSHLDPTKFLSGSQLHRLHLHLSPIDNRLYRPLAATSPAAVSSTSAYFPVTSALYPTLAHHVEPCRSRHPAVGCRAISCRAISYRDIS